MKNITVDEILMFHKKIIRQIGGSEGVRDSTLIESALNRASMTFDGKDLYPETIEKIAVITYSLIKNHGFVDGNKRIGVATMILLLKLNDINVRFSQRELINLGLEVADGTLNEKDIEKWIRDHLI